MTPEERAEILMNGTICKKMSGAESEKGQESFEWNPNNLGIYIIDIIPSLKSAKIF